MMGAHGAQLLPLLPTPTGTTWSRAAGIQADGGRRREACPVVRVWGAPPPHTESDKAQAGANGCAHPAGLAGINVTIYTHANQL